MKECPNCGFECDSASTKCPRCGIVFEKWEAIQNKGKYEKKEKISGEKKSSGTTSRPIESPKEGKFDNADKGTEVQHKEPIEESNCHVEPQGKRKQKLRSQKKTKTEGTLAKKFEYYIEGLGSMRFRQLKEFLADGKISSETMVYDGYLQKWMKAADVAELMTPPTPKSRSFGITFIVIGIISLLFSLNMDTTVSTGGLSRVHNIGLMNDKQNFIIVSCLVIIIGVMMTAFSYLKKSKAEQPPKNATAHGFLKECPECAELVKFKAKKCRFCGHVFDE